MKLDIRQFTASPGRRFPVDFTMIPPKPEATEPDWQVLEIHVTGEAFAQMSTLYLEVDLEARTTQRCRRCLAPVAVDIVVSEPFELTISPNEDWVDPLPEALQIIEMARDPHVVCRPDCRGLCPQCGANLNESPDHICASPEESRRTLRDYLS
jgi:uncharacterized protein